MKHLTLILVALSLSLTMACSKKSSTAAVAPSTSTTNGYYTSNGFCYRTSDNQVVDQSFCTNNGNISGWPYPIGSNGIINSQPLGFIQVSNATVYKNFIQAAIDYQYNGGNVGYQNYNNYDYGYTCDFNIWDGLFDGFNNFGDCGTYEDDFDDYINDLITQGTLIVINSINGNQLQLEILLGADQDFGGNIYYETSIQLNASIHRNNNNQLVIDAGPFDLLSATGNDTLLQVSFENTPFGQVQLH